MELFFSFDQQIFFFINHLPHVWWSDFFAQALSGAGSGGAVFLLLGLFLIIREEKKDHWFLVPMLCVSGLSWFLSEIVLKMGFGRMRPSLLSETFIVGTSPVSYSFPSTHAMLAFAFAVLLSGKEPKWRWWLILLATLIGLSRIYLGYHYPMDVVVGGLLGLGIGFSIVRIYNRITFKRYKRKHNFSY